MAALRQQSLEEAEKYLKDANKAVKTTMFKWKPDVELAAELFDKAGLAFKLAKEYDKSIDAFKQAAVNHKEYGAIFHCAKSYENAANSARDDKNVEVCNKLLSQAARFYRRNGTNDAAALALERAAKEAEKEGLNEAAMDLYMEVVDIRETEDQTRRMKQPLDKAIQMSIRAKQLKSTAELLNKEALLLTQLKDDPLMNRNWMVRIVVQLAMGKFNLAEQLYEEAMSGSAFNGCEEMFAVDEMLDAYDAKDQEKLKQVTRQQLFSFLSNDSALLARNLVAKGGTGRVAKKLESLDVKATSKKAGTKPKPKTPEPKTPETKTLSTSTVPSTAENTKDEDAQTTTSTTTATTTATTNDTQGTGATSVQDESPSDTANGTSSPAAGDDDSEEEDLL